MLLMEFDQQAFESYLSSGPDDSVAGCNQRTLETGSPTLFYVHAANHSSAKQSHQALEALCRDFPRVVGGPSLPVKRNRNTTRCQSHHGRCLQMIATTAPTYPLDLSCVFYDKCASSVQSRLGSVQA